MAQILSGKKVAKAWKAAMAQRVEALRAEGRPPSLTLVRVGEDPASLVYVRGKERACEKLGIVSETIVLPVQTPADDLFALIDKLNADPAVDGFIVQLPLPEQIPEHEVLMRIDPSKDVDGFHPTNMGLLCQGRPRFLPATPAGILKILEFYEVATAGRHVVIVGRSNIVGRPLANLLTAKGPRANATVTVCHTATRDLARHTRAAEILVVAAGAKRMITADMVGEGAVVIDVGIHREPDPENPGQERLCGDVDFDGVSARAGAITPVPGGVGPTTIAALIENTILAAERR